MNDPIYNEFLETVSRRRLTVAEEVRLQAYLASRPELQAAWEDELGLSRLLEQLPAPPVSSNFTAQVLESVAAEARRQEGMRLGVGSVWWRLASLRLVPRTALAGLVLGAGLLGYWQLQVAQRSALARDIAGLRGVARVPTVEMLKNFEAINRLGAAPQAADLELLAALR